MTALSTMVVALLVMLAVPISQLRTVDIETSCCCPDPDRCHCADHEPSSGPTSIRACHSSSIVIVGAQLGSFTAPVIATVIPPARRFVAVVSRLPAPHAAPPLARLAAPS